MPAVDEEFSVNRYLAEERTKDMFRFSTAGSVDDGKSTLIGRLLYDTQSVYEDQVRSIEGKGTTAPGVLDLALLTDGLRAEREQGITIDVAYRYFSTARRKFLIADTPGHEQYTRNMATGASTADAAIVLVDARKGVLRQSRRHAYIAALLGVRQIVVAVNKMDLVEWSEARFHGVREEFLRFFADIEAQTGLRSTLHFVPVSALVGDNIVHRGPGMAWYTGATLLELLEQLPSAAQTQAGHAPLRFAVQRVVRPNLDFRGYAGQLSAGTVRPGDTVTVLPSGTSSRVRSIVTFGGELPAAAAPQSVTLTLEDELDISRGDLLVSAEAPAQVASRFTASLVWMDAAPLELHRRYLLKHSTRVASAQVTTLLHRVDLSGEGEGVPHPEAGRLELNGIALVDLETQQPLCADIYAENRHTGSFILIDPLTNATVGAGMIRDIHTGANAAHYAAVSVEERAAAWGHRGAQLVFRGDAALVERVERLLFLRKAFVARARQAAAPMLAEAGALALVHAGGETNGVTVVTAAGSERFPLPDDATEASAAVLRVLEGSGLLSGLLAEATKQ